MSMSLESRQISASTDYVIDVVSWKPRIFYINNFLTPEECIHFIEIASQGLQQSTVVSPNAGEDGKPVLHPERTSYGFCFRQEHTETIAAIEKRIAELTFIPKENGESFQAMRYEHGQQYRPHFDYFNPQLEGSKPHLLRGGQRVATVILYLSDVEEGGETIFPEIDAKVPAKQGNAVFFYNTQPNGEIDPLTLHGGAPVITGTKWIATRWLREGVFN